MKDEKKDAVAILMECLKSPKIKGRINMDNKRERIAYLTGDLEGVTQFAIWRNGEQIIGVLQTPVERIIGPYAEELRVLQKEVL